MQQVPFNFAKEDRQIHNNKCSNEKNERLEAKQDSLDHNVHTMLEPSTSSQTNFSQGGEVIEATESSNEFDDYDHDVNIVIVEDTDVISISRPVSKTKSISDSQASTILLSESSVAADNSTDVSNVISATNVSSSIMNTWPITSTPVKSKHDPKTSYKSKFIKKRKTSSNSNTGIEKYVQKTDKEKLKIISQKWAQFFYKNRIPFQVADDPSFHAALEETRTGLKHKSVLSRKQLAGPLLDEAHGQVIKEMKTILKNKMCVVSQDGWSNIHNEPIVATTIHLEGQSYPLDSVCTGSESKTANYCFQLAKKSILNAEEEYGAIIVGFISDNEPKMKLVRQLLLEWKPELIVYGCSAHYLNLVESNATPALVLATIKEVQRYFREHQHPAARLKEKGGVLPQLPNSTRWTSQRACLDTFVRNHSKYVEIRDEKDSKIAANIIPHIDNRLLLVEAKQLLLQLDTISKAINSFQDDHNTLSDCTGFWLNMIEDENINASIRTEIERRFTQVSTPQHLLSYLIDHRRNDPDNEAKRIPLTAKQQEIARNFVFNLDDAYTVVLAAYETQDDSIFPKTAFQGSMYKLSPLKYWQYIGQIALLEPVKKFCYLMMSISSCPPSSAGIERLFSSAGLIHSKLRNRLSNERVAKLVQVYRHLGWKEKSETHEHDELEDFELVANFS